MKIVLRESDIHKGNLILVNPDYFLQEEIPLNDLEIVNEKYHSILLQKEANKFLQFVLREMKIENEIVPVSGYRTLEEQNQIWKDSFKENGEEFTKKFVAIPNASEHQTGLAIDLGLNQDVIDFIRPSFPHSGICNEFRKLANKYGFIERYKKEKEKITRISAEEWHFRYVGYPHSEIIEKNHFCLEEYIEYLKQYEYGKESLIWNQYAIFYLPYEEGKEIELEDSQISGNNVDGFIVTRKVK